MNIDRNYYVKPEVKTILLQTEQVVCAQSFGGGNEGMTEIPGDFSDFE